MCQTCGWLKVGLLLFLNGLGVIVRSAFVHGQCGDLLVGLPAVVAVVGFAWSVDHMVFVQAGVLGEPLITARHSAYIRLLSCDSAGETVPCFSTSTAQCFRGQTCF